MQSLTARVSFVDDYGRAVVLTSTNRAQMVDVPQGMSVKTGDTVVLTAPDGMRRSNDWTISHKLYPAVQE